MVLKDAKLVGTSYTVVSGEYLFVLYLATNLEERSRGIGSKILDEMKDLYKDKMFVLNIDSVNKTSSNYLEQKRREKFYIKNVFIELILVLNQIVKSLMLCLWKKI